MTQVNGHQIKDLKTVLKDLESMVKDADMNGRPFLLDGNNLSKKTDRIGIDGGGSFDMRPREAWVNWLICAVLNEVQPGIFTFQEIKGGDGIIVEKNTKQGFLFEHVLAMNPPGTKNPLSVDELVVEAVNKKVQKEIDHPGYAKDKHLAVFVFNNGTGEWHPGKVAQDIHGKHPFESIYCASLISVAPDGAQSYSVTCFGKNSPVSFLVEINKDFTNWKVSLIQWTGSQKGVIK